jgi:hypothetical protein
VAAPVDKQAMTKSSVHVAMVRLFRDRPRFVGETLHKLLDFRLPAHRDMRVESGEFSQAAPPEYHADFVVSLVDVTDTSARIQVAETTHDVAPGDSFAQNFQLVRISGNCVDILYSNGDEAEVFRLCQSAQRRWRRLDGPGRLTEGRPRDQFRRRRTKVQDAAA